MIRLDARKRDRNSTTPLMMWVLSLSAIIYSLLGYCYWAMGNGSILM